MKKAIRFTTLPIVAAMLLSACGGGGTPSTNSGSTSSTPTSSTPSASSASSASASSAPAEKVDPEAKYPEPVEVKLAYATNAAVSLSDMDGHTYENNPWTQMLLDKYNIKVKIVWEAVDANDQYRTKLDLAIATNDLPDIIRTANYSQFDKLVKADKVADLTQYYEDYLSAQCKEFALQDGGKTQSYGIMDGKMMGVTASTINYTSARLAFIREDWFTEMNCTEPKTVEDVIEIAKKFADAEKGRYALPLFKKLTNDNMCDIVGVANAMGAFPRIWLDDGAGGAKYGSVQPEIKEVLRVYADLYKNGYIDPAFASLDGGKVAEQLTADKIGVIFGAQWLPTWPLNSNFELNGTNWKCYPVLPSATATGKLQVQADAPKGNMLVVNKNYKTPEVLFKILSSVTEKLTDPNEQETYHSYKKGEKTIQIFAMNPLGFYFNDTMVNFNTYKNCNAALETGDESKLIFAGDKLQYPKLKAYKEAVEKGEKPATGDWMMAQLFYGPTCAYANLDTYFQNDNFVVNLLPGYQTDTMTKQWGNLEMLEDQNFIEIITGAKDVDKGFDDFVKAWNAMGGETIVKEVNDWVKQQ